MIHFLLRINSLQLTIFNGSRDRGGVRGGLGSTDPKLRPLAVSLVDCTGVPGLGTQVSQNVGLVSVEKPGVKPKNLTAPMDGHLLPHPVAHELQTVLRQCLLNSQQPLQHILG